MAELQLSDHEREIQRGLSQTQLRFLDYARAHPELLRRDTFEEIHRVNAPIYYTWQLWPIFVEQHWIQEVGRRTTELCELVKSVPRRVFGADPVKLAAFYGIERSFAQVVSAALGNPEWVAGLLARPDTIHTADGFKCIECNITANLGGWEVTHWADAYLRVPPVARFLEETGIEASSPSTLRRLLTHVLGEALRKFRQAEINVGFAMTGLET